ALEPLGQPLPRGETATVSVAASCDLIQKTRTLGLGGSLRLIAHPPHLDALPASRVLPAGQGEAPRSVPRISTEPRTGCGTPHRCRPVGEPRVGRAISSTTSATAIDVGHAGPPR